MYKSEIIRLIPYPFFRFRNLRATCRLLSNFQFSHVSSRFVVWSVKVCLRGTLLPIIFFSSPRFGRLPLFFHSALIRPSTRQHLLASANENPILPYASAFARFGSSQYFRGIPFSLKSPPLLCVSVSFDPPTNPSARFGSSQNIRCIPFFPEGPNPVT